MPFASRLATLCLFVGASVAFGQSTTQENLGAITASHVYSGLGWQVSPSVEEEFAAAADAGASHVRVDACTWSTIEAQSAPPNNVSSGYSLTPMCISALTFAKKYDLKPTLLAAYGSPFHRILALTLSSKAASGATTLSVEYASGVGGETLSNIEYPKAYVVDAKGERLTTRYSYSGALVSGVKLTSGTTATLTLASALIVDLPVGTTLYVNEVLYPSAVTGSANDPSVVAFAHYAEFLASQIKAYGLTGDVELWNEPAWGQDCWDNRRSCFDNDPKLPGELGPYYPNYGFVAALQHATPISGVTYVWAGTNKSGGADVLAQPMLQYTGESFKQPQANVISESFHPYGSNPEDAMWIEPCLASAGLKWQSCNMIPEFNSNMVNTEGLDLAARLAGSSYGINHVITETGASSLYTDASHLPRFIMRQYLGYMANNFNYVDFYRLTDPSIPGQTGFSFITLASNKQSFTPLPSYTALAGFISDLLPMKAAPATSYPASSLPSIASYSGTYNLDHVSIVGSREGDSTNSILFALWQRSFVAEKCGTSDPCWGTVAQPEDALVTVTIPNGLKIAQALNLDTREAVSYTQSGSKVKLYVSDDPIELLLIPSGDSLPATHVTPKLLFANVANQTQGSSVTVSASSISKGAITYSVVSGPATISGATVTTNGPGAVTVEASQAANSTYNAVTATTSFSVTAKTPTLVFGVIAPKTYGDSFGVNAGSVSKGAVTYSIVSGPATISGSKVTTTGAGTVVVGAAQAVYGVYTAATATLSVKVAAKTPILVFNPIPAQTYGSPVTAAAKSASDGDVTYSVTSGPATISGSTVTLTNVGQVFLKASQAASGGYSAATASIQFHVLPKTPTLVFDSIPSTPFKTSIKVNAVSPSEGTILYKIVSGPAHINGSTVTTLSTAGTVVLEAFQSPDKGYNSATAKVSFDVAATVTPDLAFASLPTTVAVGDVVPVKATSSSPGPITYTLVSGPATISASGVSLAGTGTVTLKATQAASGLYKATATTISITVAGKRANLAFVNIPPKTFGDKLNVNAISVSPGAITYSVASGPAIISGRTVLMNGSGTVVLQADQAASGGYAAGTATISFPVAPDPFPLTFVNIPPKTDGDTLVVRANAASPGDITYSVVSGPATVSKATVKMVGVGTVVLRANQAASGVYPAATTTISFPVAAKK
jgi:hypothetical protein